MLTDNPSTPTIRFAWGNSLFEVDEESVSVDESAGTLIGRALTSGCSIPIGSFIYMKDGAKGAVVEHTGSTAILPASACASNEHDFTNPQEYGTIHKDIVPSNTYGDGSRWDEI